MRVAWLALELLLTGATVQDHLSSPRSVKALPIVNKSGIKLLTGDTEIDIMPSSLRIGLEQILWFNIISP
jgi:hypothetical protein